MHKQCFELPFYDVWLLQRGQYMSSINCPCVSCNCWEKVKLWKKKKIVAVSIPGVCQAGRNKKSRSDLMCGDCSAQPHEYLFHPWTVLVFQVPAEWRPCCSCLQPSRWVTNQSSRTHLAHPSGWHWRNQWDSWREGYSPALSLSILRYLEFQQELGQFAVGLRVQAMEKVSRVANMWRWELRGRSGLDLLQHMIWHKVVLWSRLQLPRPRHYQDEGIEIETRLRHLGFVTKTRPRL